MSEQAVTNELPEPESDGGIQIDPSIEQLVEMLTYKRPAGSKHERKFINRFIRPLGVQQDDYGNLWKIVGGDTSILWSSHTDSVHLTSGRQELAITDKGHIVLAKQKSSNCLGADDAAGVWMMTEMIKAGVPGLYVFHREEECGGGGSQWFVKSQSEMLKTTKAAIAFDRYGTTSVITHQWGGRCCSDEFGLSLAKAVGMDHKLDTGGSFTDTANYTLDVGECTNLSIGYYRQHTADESLDVGYLTTLRRKMLAFDSSQLVFKREPGELEDIWRGGSPWSNYLDGANDYGVTRVRPSGRTYKNIEDTWDDDSWIPGRRNLFDLCHDHPAEVADFLEQCGINPQDIEDYIDEVSGTYRRRGSRKV